ncbi:MAG: SRPBCC domain-containing protein [Thermoanaerobaculia bacterium]|nr:SRPBCC domain-containing protein [Thermoanaerobaculia bacterium]
MNRIMLVVAALLVSIAAVADEPEIRAEVIVNAPREAVWKAWTTEEGIKTFFAPASHVELVPDGAYEIFFAPESPAGQRGTDGMRVLLVQPPSALAFTWNAPPSFPEQRKHRTHVMIRLYAIDEKTTRVLLVHDGFGEGPEWLRVRDYFQKAWTEYVLARLVKSFEPK